MQGTPEAVLDVSRWRSVLSVSLLPLPLLRADGLGHRDPRGCWENQEGGSSGREAPTSHWKSRVPGAQM